MLSLSYKAVANRSIKCSKMFFYALEIAVGLLYLVSTTGAAPTDDEEKCSCLDYCKWKYTMQDNQSPEIETSCRRGCRFYHVSIRGPQKVITTPKVKDKALNTCALSCVSALEEKVHSDACIEGCRNGCKIKASVQPRVKLTIVVMDAIPEDGIELEQFLTDPAIKQQVEASSASHGAATGNTKTKIPASYFTNLPVMPEMHEVARGCGPEPRLCDGWLAGEPLLCAGLLILAAGLLLAAYWRRGALPDAPDPANDYDQAPLLPEKVPLQLTV